MHELINKVLSVTDCAYGCMMWLDFSCLNKSVFMQTYFMLEVLMASELTLSSTCSAVYFHKL